MSNNTVAIDNHIPDVDITFLPTDSFNIVLDVVKSNKFYPLWITGLAGCGKSQMVEQAFARANLPDNFNKLGVMQQQELILSGKYKGKPFIRINFTNETDESQLIGGYEFINGQSVFREGPITQAVRYGYGVLLDEVDAGHVNRILTLQSVMEGKGVFIKEKNEWVPAAEGFQVFATSNTKGRGSEDGKFVGTNIMNGAFLDRFCGVIEHDYPTPQVEFQIIKYVSMCMIPKGNIVQDDKDKINEILSDLVDFAGMTRKAYENGTSEEFISTRALINIVRGMFILKDVRKALKLAVQRFNEVERDAFLDLFEKTNSGKSYMLQIFGSQTNQTETISPEFEIDNSQEK